GRCCTMRERWDLTIFEADGVTPVLGSVGGSGEILEATFSTDPAHPRPCLEVPSSMAESSVDLLKGAAKIGEYSLTLTDIAPAGDQDAGAVTAILADASGQSALNGRRAVLRRFAGGAWVV